MEDDEDSLTKIYPSASSPSTGKFVPPTLLTVVLQSLKTRYLSRMFYELHDPFKDFDMHYGEKCQLDTYKLANQSERLDYGSNLMRATSVLVTGALRSKMI